MTYLPVEQYCQKNKVDRAKVYRLIRERKIKLGKDYKVIEKTVKRIVVNTGLEI